jgi:hypothetical protein
MLLTKCVWKVLHRTDEDLISFIFIAYSLSSFDLNLICYGNLFLYVTYNAQFRDCPFLSTLKNTNWLLPEFEGLFFK